MPQSIKTALSRFWDIRFVVTYAEYGIPGVPEKTIEVHDRLNALRHRGGPINFYVNNATMGGDPAPGEFKTLIVRWKKWGRLDSRSFTEETHVGLPD